MAALIRGTVRDHRGLPAAGVRVAIVRGPIDLPGIVAVTGDDGRFLFAPPETGQYIVACYADGFEPAHATAGVGGLPIEIHLRLASN